MNYVHFISPQHPRTVVSFPLFLSINGDTGREVRLKDAVEVVLALFVLIRF